MSEIESDRNFLLRVAGFVESDGVDSGGYSNETRAEIQADADRLRRLAEALVPSSERGKE